MNKLQRYRASWKADKAVQDNVVESWLCVNCGINTAPGFLSGPEVRLALARDDKLFMRFTRSSEVYSVKDRVWAAAGMRTWNGCLCIGCLEARLGRQLRPKDFDKHDESWRDFPSTERLAARRGVRPSVSVLVEVEVSDTAVLRARK